MTNKRVDKIQMNSTVMQNDYRYIKSFRDFVDKYAEDNHITIDQALEQDNVKIVWKQYTES